MVQFRNAVADEFKALIMACRNFDASTPSRSRRGSRKVWPRTLLRLNYRLPSRRIEVKQQAHIAGDVEPGAGMSPRG